MHVRGTQHALMMLDGKGIQTVSHPRGGESAARSESERQGQREADSA